jgi:hypothetical protein
MENTSPGGVCELNVIFLFTIGYFSYFLENFLSGIKGSMEKRFIDIFVT